MKSQADDVEAELGQVSRWRRGRRAELNDAVDELREQERKLLGELGARG